LRDRDEVVMESLLKRIGPSPILPELAASAFDSWRERQFTNPNLGEPWLERDVLDPVGLDVVLTNAGIDLGIDGGKCVVVFTRVSGAKTWFLNQKCGLLQRMSGGKIRVFSTETRPGNWIADELKAFK